MTNTKEELEWFSKNNDVLGFGCFKEFVFWRQQQGIKKCCFSKIILVRVGDRLRDKDVEFRFDCEVFEK
jgi:hypothetical protein